MALVPFSSRSKPASQSATSSSTGMFDGLFEGVSILERLDEVRRRIVRSVVVVGVGILIGFAFINQVVGYLLAPTRHALPAGTKLIYTQPGEAFGLYVQIALIVGVVFAMPFLMYQIWQLVAPLVPKSARRFAIPFVLFTTIGFIGGAAFNHYVAFPYMMAFFSTFDTPQLKFMPRVEDVFDLYTKMLLGMGVVFQMPAAVFFLAKAGLVSASMLLKSFKYAFLVIFIVAAVITPTGDMVTQTIFAAPMVALYLLSILVAWIFGPKRAARDGEQ
jgi:sec-independent protein translocase protein TatC